MFNSCELNLIKFKIKLAKQITIINTKSGDIYFYMSRI